MYIIRALHNHPYQDIIFYFLDLRLHTGLQDPCPWRGGVEVGVGEDVVVVMVGWVGAEW